MSMNANAVLTRSASLLCGDSHSFTRMIPPLLLVALALIGSGLLHGRQRLERGQAGRFDYYVLALSWSPEFCAQDGPNRSYRECDARRHLGFIVHGLWPQRHGGSQLEYCRRVPPVPHAIVEDMLSIMPDRSLIQHEWRAHGSCSGLSARDYFAEVKKAFYRVKIPREFENRERQFSEKPGDIDRLFQTAGGLSDSAAIRTVCKQSKLTEVRICFSRNLEPIRCGNDVGECQAPLLYVRPIP
jgi:ribonuclease T2